MVCIQQRIVSTQRHMLVCKILRLIMLTITAFKEYSALIAAKCHTAAWGITINESTARWLQSEYLEKLNQKVLSTRRENNQSTDEPITIKALETKQKVDLRAELDAAVQEYVQSLRLANGFVNAIVDMSVADGIVSAKNISMLKSHGGRIVITKSWARWPRSLLSRMGYMK